MHYLPNLSNPVRTLTLAMTNAVASQVVDLTSVSKSGSGRVTLTGSYTGGADATFDLQITADDPAGNAQVTEPRFTGVGNGAMTDVVVDGGVDAQLFTVALQSTGVTTARAQVQFGPVVLRALASGSAGNGIVLTISHAALTATATPYATRDILSGNTIDIAGEQWNFGAADLIAGPNGAQVVPADAPRIRFGDDPQIYRHYRFFRQNHHHYGFCPPIRRAVPADTPVYAITGTRTLTLTQGATTETVTGIVTLYDALSGIQALPSALIEVDGVVAQDMLPPDGMGAVDLSFWTSSYYDGITREGTRYMRQAELDIELQSDAPTQVVTVQCTRADTPGAEVWSVAGASSGPLSDLTTGVAYSDGPFTSMLVPVQEGETTQQAGTITISGQRLEQGCVALGRPVLGAAATTKTIRWTYTRRDNDDCNCEAIPIQGGPKPECLGVIIPGTEDDMGAAADKAAALKREIAQWAGYVRSALGVQRLGRVYVNPDETIVSDGQTVARIFSGNLRIFEAAIAATTKAIDDCISDTGLRAKWVGLTAYELDIIRRPTAYNGRVYVVTTAGTSGASEPSWNTTLGAPTTDGTVTWTTFEYDAPTLIRARWLELADHLKRFVHGRGRRATTDLTDELGTPVDYRQIVTPGTRNGHWYEAVSSEAQAINQDPSGAEPTWPTDGTTVTWDSVVFQDRGAYWTAATAKRYGDIMDTYGSGVFVCIAAGTTHASAEPDWEQERITDGTVTWARVAQGVMAPIIEVDDSYSASNHPELHGSKAVSYATFLGSWFRDVYMRAGVVENFDNAGGPGTGCWQDQGGQYWWVADTGAYLPAFTNWYYHSTTRTNDANGRPVITETREFGFQISACPELLTEGDYIDVSILVTGGNGLGTYAVGDLFRVACVRASPLELAGGVDGDNTLTWSVTGSVDGPLAAFDLVLTDPMTWDYDDGDLAFSITPGAIAFAPGDTFTFAVEGGEFRWRKNGGAWVEDVPIDSVVSLSDGLSAAFAFGVEPAFVPGDSWSFVARAINGVAQLRSPDGARASWSGGTVISVSDASPIAVSHLLLADHTIPSGQTITLTGSDDAFATTPTSISIPWQARHLAYVLDAPVSRLAWRLTISGAGSADWLFLGEGERMRIPGGGVELGAIERIRRMPTAAGVRAGKSYRVQHSAITQASADTLAEMLEYACQYDQRRIGVIPNEQEPEFAELVEYVAESLTETDQQRGFQPRSPSHRLISVDYLLDAAP